MAARTPPARPKVCVVGFHHARGPEIESWYGVEPGTDPAADNDWSFLPFMALSDGAHLSTEDFSYFSLRQSSPPKTLFGMSCTRQIDARELLNRPEDVTRSTVQKSLVVVAETPVFFGQWREKLSMVTRAWFEQRDFTNTEILKAFQESLAARSSESDEERDRYLGVSLREFIHEYKHQVLVMFKCCLLQPKMLFFGSKCEKLCMVQFALISLIPGLLGHLEDCGDPEYDSYEKSFVPPIFGKGSLFGPYTPLQQLDVLADYGTKSYVVGSTNSLLLQQKDRYSDILVNLDDGTVNITSHSLRSAASLSVADRRWIDFLYTNIHNTWDPNNPTRPRDHGYLASEEFIRLQFEEYILSLLAATKYHEYLYATPYHKRELTAFTDIEGDPAMEFGESWIEAWKQTANYKLWTKHADAHLFDIVDPRHPTAGGLSIEDINRRVAQQIADMHLDERLTSTRETLNKHLVTGQKKVSTAITHLWTEYETLRAAQRAKAAAQRQSDAASPSPSSVKSPPQPLPPSNDLPSPSNFSLATPERSPSSAATPSPLFDTAALRARAPDLGQAQAAAAAAGQRAGAYLSSWGAWASERRKGWGGKKENGSNGGGGDRGGEKVGEKDREKKEKEEHEEQTPPKGPRKTRGAGSGWMGLRGGRGEKVGSDGIGRLDA